MDPTAAPIPTEPALARLSVIDRFLPVWILSAMALGLGLGRLIPNLNDWLDTVKIGYEISFNKYFYRHKPLRSLDKVTADILALEQQADGLISDILGVPVAALSEVE